ncbi:4Fe-4S dicluster domain-containing protein [Acetivibrio clariflavus]|uniref:4Fe-4S dicluster domain-containing protein n=1 Tax=Acetivibrio clariflavus TaxID=288965 RepID=UPI000483E47B|nr:4Fe-4S dicluster domain-containing protein [Acetivibrio clariflavus]
MFAFNMTKSIFKNLFTKSPAARASLAKKEFKRNTRGKIDINIESCVFCGICQKKCPTGAISVNRTDKKWEIERLKCITCGYCVEACPKKCLSMGNEYSGPALSKDKEVFKNARVLDNATNS